MSDFMDDWEKELEESRRKEEEERLAFLDKCLTKLTDPELAYRCLALRVAQRFKIREDYCGFPDSVYAILNYWVEEVDEDFESWLNKDDAPLIRKATELNRIFPELNFETNLRKKVELINRIYGVELYYDGDDYLEDYVYSYSFDFNSFTPLPVKKIHNLKKEISILEKYGADASALRKELEDFDLPEDVLEVI